MSWYTFFFLKPDSKYANKTIEDCQLPNIESTRFGVSDKSILKARMIDMYYTKDNSINDTKRRITEIAVLVESIISDVLLEYPWVALNTMLQDPSDKSYCINHCISESSMMDSVDNYYKNKETIISNLTNITLIHFEPDSYSDTPKTTADYLETEYMNRIESELEVLDELTRDYGLYKFLLNECIRKEENDPTLSSYIGEESEE